MNRETLRAALLLGAVLHLCFFPCLWGSKTFLSSSEDAPSIMPLGAWAGKPVGVGLSKTLDAGGPAFMTEPLLKLAGSQYAREHNFPLWNPHQGYGVPLAADMQAQPFFPLSALLSLHLTPRTYNWFILLRLWIAGLFAYLYLRFWVGFLPAVAGGISSMLAGYYVLFITMPQLSVETLLPAALWAMEGLFRKGGYKALVRAAAVICLSLLGGMPESSLLLLSFAALYFAFRLLSDPILRGDWRNRLAQGALAGVAGAALAAMLLLPFGEFMRRSFDSHQPANIGGVFTGVLYEHLSVSVFTYFFPLLFGPPFSNTLAPGQTGLRNYFGLVGVVLMVVAVAGLFRRNERRPSGLGPLTCFFAVCLFAAVLKRYGFPLVNIIGYLPLFRLVWFVKYQEAIVSMCVSVLCAVGLERFLRGQVSRRLQVSALVSAFLLIPLALAFSWRILIREVLVEHVRPTIPLTAVGVPICLLFAVAVCFILFNGGSNRRLTAALLSLGSIELALNYLAPQYYFFNKLPYGAHNPYAGAPYVAWLQRQKPEDGRVFGREGLLFPNWASAFGLYDIRNLDAMYYKKYFPFLHNFLPFQSEEDLRDRFNGSGNYDIRTPLARRLLQLSSVKYIAGRQGLLEKNATVEEILRQDQSLLAAGASANVAPRNWVLNGETREGLGEHPPYRRLPYRTAVESAQTFHFSYGLDPAVFDKTEGDGVGFTIEIQDASGAIKKVFSNYIDPKHNPRERRWMDGILDLRPYRGQSIQLLFSTDPGPKGDSAYDWAAWSDFYFDEKPARTEQLFEPVYNGEAQIYRYGDVLPRAAIYYAAEVRANEGEVLRRLADPALDVFQTVVLNGGSLPAGQKAAIAAVNGGPARRVQTARILSYQSQSVLIEAKLDRPGILVLNDSDYPGWAVEIDGRRGEWFTANYLFRGVLLNPGAHTVRFVYRPRSFFYGALISFTAFLSLLAFGLARKRSARPAAAPTPAEAGSR